jgi:glycosidase
MQCSARGYGLALAAVAALACCASSRAQRQALAIAKIDPPNWFATLPKAMLLINGTGLGCATFSISDRSIMIEQTIKSANGHWAQLYLSASPPAAETVTIRAACGRGAQVEWPYTFAARRAPGNAPNAGFGGFSPRDVMYLIMTDRFADGDLSNDGPNATDSADSAAAAAERAKPRGWHGGDLRGIAQHLDYLRQLGVTAVWTTPVYRNHGEPDSYHGYGATDLYAVDEHYGSLDDLKQLARALHTRGMKLVLDTVPNHVGPHHPWVNDEPAPDWFHGTAAHHLKGETNFQALIDPHAPERDKLGTLDGWFGDALPDMNTEKPALAKYLRQNAEWWIEETGADALRIDTFPYVNREFWHDFNGELKQLYPRLTEVGEIFNADSVIVSSFAGGVTRAGSDTGLTTPFDFPTYFALRDIFTKGAPMSKLASTLAMDSLYPHPERLPTFFGNHDTTRFMDAATGTEAQRETSLRLAFAAIMTTRGMPQIYSGDELAMHGGEDPDNRRDFPGGFPAEAGNAFVADGRTPVQQEMVSWVSALTALRRAHPALACGAEQVLASDDDWLVTVRDAGRAAGNDCGPGTDTVLTALYRGSTAAALKVPLQQTWISSCVSLKPEIVFGDSSATIAGSDLTVHAQAAGVFIATCGGLPAPGH